MASKLDSLIIKFLKWFLIINLGCFDFHDGGSASCPQKQVVGASTPWYVGTHHCHLVLMGAIHVKDIRAWRYAQLTLEPRASQAVVDVLATLWHLVVCFNLLRLRDSFVVAHVNSLLIQGLRINQ
jgi:hypothetical protein